MDIFEFQDYRDFIKKWIEIHPAGSRGQLLRFAQSLGINPATVTLVLKGVKDFTLEQAMDACDYFALSGLETEFFMTLVLRSRAGKPNLKKSFENKIAVLREKALNLKDRLPAAQDFDESAKATFYSQWFYSGVRLASALPNCHSAEQLADRLELPHSLVQQVLKFLIETGLCVRNEAGVTFGPRDTHIGADDPMVLRHHTNWRQKAIEQMPVKKGNELYYTHPMALAQEDISKVRQLLVQAIDQIVEVVGPSESEEVMCLNIDWFTY